MLIGVLCGLFQWLLLLRRVKRAGWLILCWGVVGVAVDAWRSSGRDEFIRSCLSVSNNLSECEVQVKLLAALLGFVVFSAWFGIALGIVLVQKKLQSSRANLTEQHES